MKRQGPRVYGPEHASLVIRELRKKTRSSVARSREKSTGDDCRSGETNHVSLDEFHKLVVESRALPPEAGTTAGGVEYSADELQFYRQHVAKAHCDPGVHVARTSGAAQPVVRQPPARHAFVARDDVDSDWSDDDAQPPTRPAAATKGRTKISANGRRRGDSARKLQTQRHEHPTEGSGFGASNAQSQRDSLSHRADAHSDSDWGSNDEEDGHRGGSPIPRTKPANDAFVDALVHYPDGCEDQVYGSDDDLASDPWLTHDRGGGPLPNVQLKGKTFPEQQTEPSEEDDEYARRVELTMRSLSAREQQAEHKKRLASTVSQNDPETFGRKPMPARKVPILSAKAKLAMKGRDRAAADPVNAFKALDIKPGQRIRVRSQSRRIRP